MSWAAPWALGRTWAPWAHLGALRRLGHSMSWAAPWARRSFIGCRTSLVYLAIFLSVHASGAVPYGGSGGLAAVGHDAVAEAATAAGGDSNSNAERGEDGSCGSRHGGGGYDGAVAAVVSAGHDDDAEIWTAALADALASVMVAGAADAEDQEGQQVRGVLLRLLAHSLSGCGL